MLSIQGLDLNLLLLLHTVLTERSVARAAARLHVTPSAVSNSLARLREVLGDPLFTRQGRGIAPTPRALELAPVLARTLAELDRAVSAAPFDPARCDRTFTLALADVGQVAWVPGLTRALQREMPQARLILTAERPLTVFNYNGFNPEVANGWDTQTYPIPAVYTVGLNVKF